ncbi:hypothetical protein niasHT_004118 [Heterodera trifolii]|uniref:Uncharacterized protein n=1 Tax=Heterodera trifolii TaxID=157864 RepID=A0ABD2LSM6_9BILA
MEFWAATRAVDVRVVDEHGNLIYTPPPAAHVPQLLEQFIQDVNSAIGQASIGLMEARVVAAWAHYQLIVDTIHLKIIDRHGALGGNIRAVDMIIVDEHGNFIYTPPPSTHVPELLDQFIHDVNSAIGQVSTGLMEARVVAACYSDANGNFKLSGHTSELTNIDVVFKVYHDCDDGIKPGSRKLKFKIPNSYVTDSATPKKTFDIGVLNLETVFKDEERELIVTMKKKRRSHRYRDFLDILL